MANAIFGTPIYSDANETYTPALSGGSWSSDLPLTNLQDRRLSKVARSASAALANTKFEVDLGVARSVGLFAIPKHNFDLNARVRIRGSSTAGNFTPNGSNFLLHSEAFNNVIWQGTGTVSVSANTTTDYAGTSLADTISFGATITSQIDQTISGEAGQTCTFSIYLRGSDSIEMYFYDNVSGFQTETVTPSASAWARFTMTRTYGVGATDMRMGLRSNSTNDTVIAWGAQGERASSASTYTPTTSSTVTVSGSPVVYDSDWLTVFPSAASMTAEELAEQQAQGFNFGFVHVPSSAQSARYWQFEIDDVGIAAGYVELGRLVIAGAWQPTINMEYGVKMGWETSSTRTESDGGAAIYNERPRRRNVVGVIGHLPESEALTNPYDMQRKLGTTKQLFFIFDPDDVAHMHRRSFLAVNRELNPLEYPYHARNAMAFSLVEEL
jgi:hypothetical protein